MVSGGGSVNLPPDVRLNGGNNPTIVNKPVQLNGGKPITGTSLKVHPAVPGAGSSLGTAMPMDSQGLIEAAQARQARDAYINQIIGSQQDENLNYGQQHEALLKQQPLDQATLNSTYGGHGLGFSSGWGKANSQLGDAYTTATTNLDAAHQNTLSQLLGNETDYRNNFKQTLAAIRQAAADRLSANAGSLGLAQPTTDANLLATLLQGVRV